MALLLIFFNPLALELTEYNLQTFIRKKNAKAQGKPSNRAIQEWPKLFDVSAALLGNSTCCLVPKAYYNIMLTSSARHTLIVRSCELLYKRPAPPHFTHVTALEWPVSVNRVCPSTTSHILMSPSLEPLAIRLHSGLLKTKTFIQMPQMHILYIHKSKYVACFHYYDKLDKSTFLSFIFVCIKILHIYQISKYYVLTPWTELHRLLYVPPALM